MLCMQTCRMFAYVCSVRTIWILLNFPSTFSKLKPAHGHAPDPWRCVESKLSAQIFESNLGNTAFSLSNKNAFRYDAYRPYVTVRQGVSLTEIPHWTETPRHGSPGQRLPHWTETPWTETSQIETPLDRDPLDRDPQDRDPLDKDPWTETPHWIETPHWTETPTGQRPPGQRPLGQRPPWTENPCGQKHRPV